MGEVSQTSPTERAILSCALKMLDDLIRPWVSLERILLASARFRALRILFRVVAAQIHPHHLPMVVGCLLGLIPMLLQMAFQVLIPPLPQRIVERWSTITRHPLADLTPPRGRVLGLRTTVAQMTSHSPFIRVALMSS